MKNYGLLFLLILSGCATTAAYEKILNGWVGESEERLVRVWGPPVNVYQTGNKKFLTYSRQSNMYMPGQAPTYQTTYIGNTAYTRPVGGYAGQNIPLSCVTTFELENNYVVSWKWEGNHCKAWEQ